MPQDSNRNILHPGFRLPGKKVAHCHKMIAKTAQDMAHVLFDEMMSRDVIWTQFKRDHPGLTTKEAEEKFVAHMWPQLIESARATLASMLSGPYPDEMKEDIMDALVKDRTLMRGRGRAMHQVMGQQVTK